MYSPVGAKYHTMEIPPPKKNGTECFLEKEKMLIWVQN